MLLMPNTRDDKFFLVLHTNSNRGNFTSFNAQGCDCVNVTFEEILNGSFRALVAGYLDRGNNVHILFENKMSFSIARPVDYYQTLHIDFSKVGVGSRMSTMPYQEIVSDYNAYEPPHGTDDITLGGFVAAVCHNAKQLLQVLETPPDEIAPPEKESFTTRFLRDQGVTFGDDDGWEFISVDLNKFETANLTTAVIALWLQRVERVEFRPGNGSFFAIQLTNNDNFMNNAYHAHVGPLNNEPPTAGMTVITAKRARDERTHVTSVFFEEDRFEDAAVHLLQCIKNETV